MVINADGKTVPSDTLFNDAVFQAGLAVRQPGLWTIPAAPLALFGTTPTAPLLPATILTAPGITSQTPPPYYDPALSALCLSLAAPAYAFGDTLYPRNLMAASLQKTAAAATCAELCARGVTVSVLAEAIRLLYPVQTTNNTAPDAAHAKAIKAAVEQAVSGLTGLALNAVNDGLVLTGSKAASWRAKLAAALNQPRPASLRQRLTDGEIDAATVAANLSAWLDTNALAIGPWDNLDRAAKILAAATLLINALADGAQQKPAVARPLMGAAVQEAKAGLSDSHAATVQSCIQNCLGQQADLGIPNPPWLPMASAVSIDYTATATAAAFHHLLPFGGSAAAAWPAALLAPQDAAASLLIDLSEPAPTLSLLFLFSPGAEGWPSDGPLPSWAQASGGGWVPLDPLADDTDHLRHSGIAALALPGAAPCLRISVTEPADQFPLLAGLLPNALTASWVGPGGGAGLGTPLPAGTIKASVPPLAELTTIDQPLQSFGGRPAAEGRTFQMWQAERLRHKGFGIQAWDYARLVLAEFPAVWQVAIVPASAPGGQAAPGQVWVVVVPGPATPYVPDPTIPAADPVLLADIAAMLKRRISAFIQPAVTNPPYLRLTVIARLLFSDADSAAAWIARLNTELIAWLSPWPPQDLGPRPARYYTKHGIAEFIRHRPYVLGILSLAFDAPPDPGAWYYLTSAAAHHLSGETAPMRPRLRAS